MTSSSEFEEASRFVQCLGVSHKICQPDVLSIPEVVANGVDRCYFCKKAVFSTIWKAAKKDGYNLLLDGTNASDDASDRPGMKALQNWTSFHPCACAALPNP